MTPRPKSPTPRSTILTLRILPETLAAMREIQDRDGVPVAEQARRGIQIWLDSKGVTKADRKRVLARKRP